MNVKFSFLFVLLFGLLFVPVFAQEVESVNENEIIENENNLVLESAFDGENSVISENEGTDVEFTAEETSESDELAFDLAKLVLLESSLMTKSEDGSAGIIVKTDIKNADIYLNGNFQGRTDLEVMNLLPGMYVMEVKKNGFRDEIFQIEVKSGIISTFSVNLTELKGTLTLKNLLPGTKVQVDGYQYRKIITANENESVYKLNLVPGRYFLTFSKFGYESTQSQIYVNAFEDTELKVQLNEMEMLISGLRASRKTINPEYKNIYGKVVFTFFVSASSPLSAFIEDDNGNEVWRTDWKEFTTWKQGFEWDGSYQDIGKKVPDGNYTVHISSDHFDYTMVIIVNRGSKYPLLTPTAAGSGIGTLPALFSYSEPYFAPFVTVAPDVHLADGTFNFYDVKTSAGFISKGSRNREFSLVGNLNPGYSDGFIGGFSTSLKFYGTAILDENNTNLCLGLLLRYGLSNAAFANMTGIDTGNGLGGGLLVNVDGKYVGTGLSSQFIFGSQTGLLNKKDNLWKNGVTFSVKLGNTVRADLWGALCSYFGEESSWTKAIDTGVDLKFMVGKSNALFDMNFNYTNIFGKDQFFAQSFGLYYLF